MPWIATPKRSNDMRPGRDSATTPTSASITGILDLSRPTPGLDSPGKACYTQAVTATPEELEAERKKKTFLLMAGGALSLLLPLLGVLYLKLTDSSGSRPLSSGGTLVFDRHTAGSDPRITPAGLPAAGAEAAPRVGGPAGAAAGAPQSSLSMIVAGSDYYKEPAAAPAAPTALQQAQSQAGGAAPYQAPLGQAQAAAVAARGTSLSSLTPGRVQRAVQAPKAWQQPRLQPSKFGGMSSWAGSPGGSGIGAAGAAAGAGMGGAPGAGMGGVPGGAAGAMAGMGGAPGAAGAGGAGGVSPAMMQQLMEQAQGAGAGAAPGGPGGAPNTGNIGGMLQNAMQGAPAGTPDVSSMLQNIPGMGGSAQQQQQH